MYRLGFIGMGNMAKAIAGGLIRRDALKGNDICAYAPHQDKLTKNAEKIGFTPMKTLAETVEHSEMLIMACKPYQVESVLQEVGSLLGGKSLVSMAAGWMYADYAQKLDDTRIQCIMPNTPAQVGEGVFLMEETNSLRAEEREFLCGLLEKLGITLTIPTRLMGIGEAVSGCGPAFMDLVMEAYADAAVKYGIPRDAAYMLVAHTMLGSARLMLETGMHPGELKDAVCSPGGSTIRGVSALEDAGFRSACIHSIDAVMDFKHQR